MREPQVVEPDARVGQPELLERVGGADHDVGCHQAGDLLGIEALDVCLQRIEPHGFRFVRHVTRVQELRDANLRNPGRRFEQPCERELGHDQDRRPGRIARDDDRGLVLLEPPLGDSRPEAGRVVDVARHRCDQRVEAGLIHLAQRTGLVEQHGGLADGWGGHSCGSFADERSRSVVPA
jgi:hypothetical protein